MAKKGKTIVIPETGIPRDQVLKSMLSSHEHDANWKGGKVFAYVYNAGEEHYEFLKKAHGIFMSDNALNPMAFPSLKNFEAETISMVADMLGGDRKVFGNITTCGTESNMMAVKTYREWARATKPHIKAPEMVVSTSVHPSIDKGAHYFDVKLVKVPWKENFDCDVKGMKDAITENTIAMVGSACEYPRGMVDPITELGQVALDHDIGLHVDGCLGGFMLPWVKKLGYPVPDFDLNVPGTTSMSADLHKYGFAAKGASAIVFKNEKLWKHMFFATVDWPGGFYGSPTMAGTRGGGSIAAAWAALKAIGQDGYMALAKQTMDVAKKLQAGINAMPELKVLGNPAMTVFSFSFTDRDPMAIYAVGDVMEKKGWIMDRLQHPPALHLIVGPLQGHVVDQYLVDLRESVDIVTKDPALVKTGQAAMYGMLATFPDRANAKSLVLDFLADQYKV